MREAKILMARFEIWDIKIIRQSGISHCDWGRGGGVRRSFKINWGMWDENRKSHVTDVMLRTAATLTRQDGQKHSDWGGVRGLS